MTEVVIRVIMQNTENAISNESSTCVHFLLQLLILYT